MNPILSSLGASGGPLHATTEPSWQAGIESLFREARQVEMLLAGMLGGAASDVPADQLPDRLATSLAQLRTRADHYRAQAAE
jgi:hypothetical protein